MKPFFDPPPELASDLEWLLQNGDPSRAALADLLVREYYAGALRLSWAILGDLGQARQTVIQAFANVLVNQYRYRSGSNVQIWLFQFILQAAGKAAGFQSGSGASPVAGEAPPASGLEVFLLQLDQADRWSLYLTALLGWQPAEAAELVGIEAARVKRLADALHQESPHPLLPGQFVAEPLTLEQALRHRFPQPSLDEQQLEQIVSRLLHSADQRSTRNLRLVRLWEMLLTAGAVCLVTGLIWWLNQSLPVASQPALQSTPTRHLVRVTRMVLVPITATPGVPDRVGSGDAANPSLPTLPPLTANSSPQQIIQRLASSQSLWSTLWVDARLTLDGPPGYIGPPDVTYEQAWVDNSGKRSLELSGKSPNQPDWVYAVNGTAGSQIDRKTFQPQDFPSNQLIKNTSLRAMLLPMNSNWLSYQDNLLIGSVTPYIGRQTLQVAVQNASGFLQARLWIDVETGVILRDLRYSGDRLQTQTADFSINKIRYNHHFSDGLFNPQERLAAGFSADASGQLSKPEIRTSDIENSQAHQSFFAGLPPPGYNLAQARLYFQFPDTFNTGAASALAEVLAGGYSLGKTQFGNPWTMICARSPDGGKIAYVSQPLNPQNGDATLHWFDLQNVSQNHLVSGDLAVDNFAFSYDGQKLAFFGRQAGETRGAVYIYNLHSGSLQLLLDRNSAHSLVWSPDGNYLAMLSAPSMLGTQDALVVQVLNGQKVARDRFNWDAQTSMDSLSPGWPTFDWRYPDGTYARFPSVMGGLQSCTLPDIQGPN